MQNIYTLKLGESYEDEQNDYVITRVPGGWIFYKYYVGMNSSSKTSVFVPFNNEFKINK